MDLQGGAINYAAAGGRDISPYSAAGTISEGHTFSHMKIWDWESGIYNAYSSGSIFEYIEMFDIHPANWQTWHPNGIYISSPANNGIVRYSSFHGGPNGYGTGEGIFFAGSGVTYTNWKIYGNKFYDLTYSGLKAIHVRDGVTVTNLLIYNNTFDNVLVPLYKVGICSTGSETKNNLVYNSGGFSTCGTASNNLQASADPFVNRASHDYRIVITTGAGYPRNAGANLSATFTVDMNGTVFGGDAAWDIGAYEFSTAESIRPAAPSNLMIVQSMP
jgi:hypothetical protein